jgi:hypothetical protein
MESVHFDGVEQAWKDNKGSSTGGKIGWKDIKFTNGTKEPAYMPNTYPVFDLPYEFTPHKADEVQKIVTAGAGNKVGNLPTLTLPGPSNEFPGFSGIMGDGKVRFFDLSGRLVGFSGSPDYEASFKRFGFPTRVYIAKQPVKSNGASSRLMIGN